MMCLATLAGGAFIAQAQRRDDEALHQDAHGTPAVALGLPTQPGDGADPDGEVAAGFYCPVGAGHCGAVGNAASVTPVVGRDADIGDDLAAALWLTGPVMDAVELGASGEADSARRADVQPQGVVGVEWRHLIEQWDDWDVSTMLRIIECESHGDPNAVSPPDYDGIANYGGLQLHGDPGGLDPVYAVQEAHRKWLTQGYHAWGCW